MLSEKSDKRAAKFREEGNEFLNQLKFYDALVAYNKSLCCAGPGSLELFLSFQARSEVFFQLGELEKCLNNIRQARDVNCSEKCLEALNEREEKCEELIASQIKSDDPRSFFKLSYPANEKIPFLVDCLELRENEKYGRHVITTRDLQPGAVIAVEESHFNFISPKSIYTKCFNCLSSNKLDLIPSSASVMFCSKKCCEEAYKKFNGRDELIVNSLSGNDIRQKMLRVMSESLFAAGSFNELQNIFDRFDGKTKTIFDFDFSDPSDGELKKKILICVGSLMQKSDCGIAEYLRDLLSMPDGARKDFFVTSIARIILIYMRNGAKLPGKDTNLPDGGMLLPFVGIVNHSCDPNIYSTFVDNKCIFMVIKPIAAGEQIFNSYRKSFIEQPKPARQAELLKTYEFNCECTACVNDYPMPNKLPKIDKKFPFPNFGSFESNGKIIAELKLNFMVMREYFEHHPCFETAAIIMRTKELIKVLGERISFP